MREKKAALRISSIRRAVLERILSGRTVFRRVLSIVSEDAERRMFIRQRNVACGEVHPTRTIGGTVCAVSKGPTVGGTVLIILLFCLVC